MARFDGILICSDWDGTLHTKDGVVEEDIKAIGHFCKNGGRFTFCSGRQQTYLNDYIDTVKPNAPVISLNGAVITDIQASKTLHRTALDDDAPRILGKVFALGADINSVSVFHDQDNEVVRTSVNSYDEFVKVLHGCRIYKIVFIMPSVESTLYLQQLLPDICDSRYTFVRSWETGIEMISSKSTKGAAALRLKNLLGAKTLVTVGDFENDIDMMQAADISYAVASAPDHVKAFASRVTASPCGGAIAEIVRDLERGSNSASK